MSSSSSQSARSVALLDPPGVQRRWEDAREAAACRSWATPAIRDLTPLLGPSCYPNYFDPCAEDGLASTYAEHTPRLLALKQHYDPEHLLRGTLSVGAGRDDA